MAKFLKNLFDKKAKVPRVDVSRRFELIARVGQGSMSKVWRARDVMTARMLAVKVLDKVKTARFESRFVGLNKPSEGDIAASLQHRNIVKTIEHGMTIDGEQYLVMEFVEGVGLSYLVDVQNEQLKEHRLSYLLQLGEAVNYLHLQNWIHRDLCPRNVMVDPDNVVKLIDFGLVVPNTPEFQKPGNRTGTANYMAPELIKRQKTDQRIDIYSFAVTCYEVYSKRLPWDVEASETMDTVLQHINKPPTPIEEMVPDIDPRMAQIIMKGLRPNPEDRWQTMSEMLLPMRKAHEDIEARKALERKKATAKAAKSPTKAISKKQTDEDDFFEQLLLGEMAATKKSPSGKPTGNNIPAAGAKSTKPAASKPATAPANVPSNADDEFDGIEIKEEGDANEFAGIEVEEPSDEFDGIEVEEEGIEVEEDGIEVEDDGIEVGEEGIEIESDGGDRSDASAKTKGSGRKLAALLNDELESPAAKHSPTAALADDDDEPILRLPDDDDEVPARSITKNPPGE